MEGCRSVAAITAWTVDLPPWTAHRLGVDYLRVREHGLVTYEEAAPDAPQFSCGTASRVDWKVDGGGHGMGHGRNELIHHVVTPGAWRF